MRVVWLWSEQLVGDQTGIYDVFISYSSPDRAAVGEIVRALETAGLRTWFDQKDAKGEFIDKIASGLKHSRAYALFVGPHGLGKWTKEELRIATKRKVEDDSYCYFAVLLPGLPDNFNLDDISPYIATPTWIDFRGGLNDPAALAALVARIQGTSDWSLPSLPSPPSPHAVVSPLKYVPGRRCHSFFGREKMLQEVALALQNPLERRRIVSFCAFGGYGKTELARSLAERLTSTGDFLQVAWISFQAVEFNLPGTISDVEDKIPPSLDSLIGAMLEQFACTTRRELQDRLADESLLIVVDNLESVHSEDERNALVSHLNKMLGNGRSRAIITSRRGIRLPFVNEIELKGLAFDDARLLLEELAEDDKIGALRRASEEELTRIYAITDGMPLALLLVGKRTRRYSSVVHAITDLEEVRGDLDIQNFCTYLFAQDWTTLSETARGLLAYLAVATATSQRRDRLQGLRLRDDVVLGDRDLDLALTEIADPGFVLRADSPDPYADPLYAMHPIARTFVLEDEIRKGWESRFPTRDLLAHANTAHRALIDRVVGKRAVDLPKSNDLGDTLERAIRDMLRTMDSYLDLSEPRWIISYWAQLNGYLWHNGLYRYYLDLQNRGLAAARALRENGAEDAAIFAAIINANLAFVYMELGQLAQAERHAVEAESLYAEIADPLEAIDVIRYQANIQCRYSPPDLAEAKRQLTRALDAWQRMPVPTAHSVAWQYRRKINEKQPYRVIRFEPSPQHVISTPAGLHLLAHTRIRNLFGYIYEKEGNYEAAARELLIAMVESRRLRIGLREFPSLAPFKNMAQLFEDCGDQKRARWYYKWCLWVTDDGSPNGTNLDIRAPAFLGLARLSHDDPDQARVYALEADRRFALLGKQRDRKRVETFLSTLGETPHLDQF